MSARGLAVVHPVPLDEAGDTLLDRRLRAVAEVARKVVDVRPSEGHVTGLEWKEILFRGTAKAPLKHLDVPEELHGAVVADVVDTIGPPAGPRIRSISGPRRIRGWRPREDSHDAPYDVVYVREVALHPAFVEDVDGPILENRLGEEEQGHVRTSPRSVHREEAKPGARQAVQMRVAVGHQLVGFLRRGVQAQRMVHVIVNREGQPRV